MKRNNTKMAYLAVLGHAIIIGFSFMFAKLIIPLANTLDILAYRFFVAFVIISVPILLGWLKLNLQIKDIYHLIPFALFYPILYFIFQTWGLLKATSAESGMIQATAPIFTLMLASIFLKEKTTIWQKSSISISVFGVILIFLLQSTSFKADHAQSLLIILLSTLAYAIYSILTRRLSRPYRSFDLSFIMVLLSFVTFISMSLIQHLTAGTLPSIIQPLAYPVFRYSIVYLGFLSTVLSVFLSNYAFSKLETYKVSVFGHVATLISIFASILFLDEPFTYIHFIGATMIIVGVLGTHLTGLKKK